MHVSRENPSSSLGEPSELSVASLPVRPSGYGSCSRLARLCPVPCSSVPGTQEECSIGFLTGYLPLLPSGGLPGFQGWVLSPGKGPDTHGVLPSLSCLGAAGCAYFLLELSGQKPPSAINLWLLGGGGSFSFSLVANRPHRFLSSESLGKTGPCPLGDGSASFPNQAHPGVFCSRGSVSKVFFPAPAMLRRWGAEGIRGLQRHVWLADQG